MIEASQRSSLLLKITRARKVYMRKFARVRMMPMMVNLPTRAAVFGFFSAVAVVFAGVSFVDFSVVMV